MLNMNIKILMLKAGYCVKMTGVFDGKLGTKR